MSEPACGLPPDVVRSGESDRIAVQDIAKRNDGKKGLSFALLRSAAICLRRCLAGRQ
ncbi:hypothetical protein GOB25_31800 [Sinorhizobium meliloti]|nr:hypothetical protein [Sinorhizobium meliloti]